MSEDHPIQNVNDETTSAEEKPQPMTLVGLELAVDDLAVVCGGSETVAM